MISLKKPFYSALVFFGTLVVLTVGYAAYSLSTESANAPLTSTKWNNVINAVNDLDTRVTSLVAGWGNLWSTGATNTINYSAGNVGIGNTTPSASLDVKRTTADANFAGYIEGTGPDNYGLGVNIANTTSTKAIADFKSGNISRLFVRADGNVGIGTTSPGSKLSVSSVGSNYVTLDAGINQENGFFFKDAGANRWALYSQTTGDNVDHFNLYSYRNSATILTALNNGNVGIGTASPGVKLEVDGDMGLSYLKWIKLRASGGGLWNVLGTTDAGTVALRTIDNGGTAKVQIQSNAGVAVATFQNDGNSIFAGNVTAPKFITSTAWTAVPGNATWTSNGMVCRRIGSFIQLNGFMQLTSGLNTSGWPVVLPDFPLNCRPSINLTYISGVCWSNTSTNSPCLVNITAWGGMSVYNNNNFTYVTLTGTYPAD